MKDKQLVRFGVSLEEPLLKELDKIAKENKFSNRSQALRSLIRENSVKQQWACEREVAGTITLIYSHSKRELMNKLTTAQHKHHHLIISTQHIHLDHDNCMEVIVVKGKPNDAQDLLVSLRSIKGVKFASLSLAATAKNLL